MAVAKLQRDLYAAVKGDPLLEQIPGLVGYGEWRTKGTTSVFQYLTIPEDAGTPNAERRRVADYANVHNYIYHPNAPLPADNKTWDAARSRPQPARWTGYIGNYGAHLGEALSGIFTGPNLGSCRGSPRKPAAASTRMVTGRNASAQSHEPVPGSVQARLELYIRLPPA